MDFLKQNKEDEMRGGRGRELAKEHGLKKTVEAIDSARNLDYSEIFDVAISESSVRAVIDIIEKEGNPLWACKFLCNRNLVGELFWEISHELKDKIPHDFEFVDFCCGRVDFYVDKLRDVIFSSRKPAWAVTWTFATGKDVDECIGIVCGAGDGYWIYRLTRGLRKTLTCSQMERLYKALLGAKTRKISSVCHFAANVKYLSLPDLKELRDVVLKSRDSMWIEWFNKNVKMHG